MNIAVTVDGCLTTYKSITNQLPFAEYIKTVTFIEEAKIGPPKRIVLLDKVVVGLTTLWKVPRAWPVTHGREAVWSIKKLERCAVEAVPSKLTLHNNQKIVIDALLNGPFTESSIEKGRGFAVIKMRAGNGKTFVAGGLIERLGRRALYIVPKKPLALQVAKDLGAAVYKKTGKAAVAAWQGARIVVIVINSAIKLGAEFWSKFGTIVLDEVHSYCSAGRAQVFWKAQAQVVLGMTATTEYKFNGVFKAHLGEVLDVAKIEGFEYGTSTEFECEARVVRYWGPKALTQNLKHETTGEVFVHYMYEQFLNDRYRLAILIGELVKLYDWVGEQGQRHCIYVFGEELELLKIAKERFDVHLRRNGRDDVAESFGLECFDGTQKESETKRVVSDGRVLFSTYGYAGTGVSILRMTAALFLTSRKSGMEQIVGRILRRGSDLAIPRVCVDLVDMGTCLRWQYEKRLPTYEEYGFVITSRTVNHPSNATATDAPIELVMPDE